MRIFVFPVSGGAFPIQLGLLSELTLNHNIKPHLSLGSSGGNIASYICHASNWKEDKMLQIINLLSPDMFAASWWPRYLTFMPSWMIGYFKGSLYACGSGSEILFHKMFTSDSICSTELWTGTLNRDTGKGQFFCNRQEKDSIIKPSNDTSINLFSRDCMPLTYMNGDLDYISKVTMASASIPVLVPEQIINDQKYVDGGTLFASPLTGLQDSILDLISDGKESLHIDYFSSFDMQINSGSSGSGTIYDNSTLSVGELIKSMCIQDRLGGIELLRTPKYAIFYTELDGDQENLKKIEELRSLTHKSLLELYPIKNNSINLLTFTPKDILNLMNEAKTGYKLRFWWIAKEELTEKDFPFQCHKLNRYRN